MNNKIVAISIAAVIGIVVLGSVLMPILDDATATTDKFTNDGIIRMTKYDDTASISVFWDHTKPHQITVNSIDIELPYASSGEFVLTSAGSASFLIRYSSTSATTGACAYVDASNNVAATTAGGTDLTVTISAGSVSATNGTNTASGSYTGYLFMVSQDGDYVMKSATQLAYLNGDSEVYGIGRTKIGSPTYSIVIEGSINDGWTASVVQTSGPTLSDVTGVYSEVNDHLDLYSFDKITLIATASGTDYDVTYNQVIVPHEVSAERSVHFSGGQNAIFAAIPVMIILARLLQAVRPG